MKIKVTGRKGYSIPKAVDGLNFSFKPPSCPDGQKKNPLTGMCEPIPNFGASSFPQIQTDLGDGFIRNPETNLYGKPNNTFSTVSLSGGNNMTTTTTTMKNSLTGVAKASMALGVMSGLNNIIQEAQTKNEYKDYMRELGTTNASNPVVKNAYSRGRNVMNTGEYAPNMMTPVQFAGIPVSEFVGYPAFPYNQYGRDGLLIAEGGALVPDRPAAFSDMMEIDIPQYNAFPTASATPAVPTSYTETASPDVNVSETSSGYVLPVKNFKLTSGFGPRNAPIKGASSNHNGVDLAVNSDSEVFSPTDGIVEKIYYNDKGGKQLIIKHLDGTKSGFAHLNDYKVSVGDRVAKGQVVALSGNTGNSSGPHLHFTFRNAEGAIVNPLDYFDIKGSGKQSKKLSRYDHNNPGNIHIGGFAQRYGAVAGRKDVNGNVAIFSSPEVGIKAMEDLIFGPGYSNLTISQARNKWVSGDTRSSNSSTSHIVKALGGDYRLRDLNPEQKKKLISEFVKWEDRDVYSSYKKQGLIYEDGGEYELDDDEINYILANGGTVEYL